MINCKICLTEFFRKRKNHVYCSASCQYKGWSKNKPKPSIIHIQDLIWLSNSCKEEEEIEAYKYAIKMVNSMWRPWWHFSFEKADMVMAAYEGYLKARERFKPPGDFSKYAKTYMRYGAKNLLREDAKAHGLTRPHQKRCVNFFQCNSTLPHTHRRHKFQKYCHYCKPQKINHCRECNKEIRNKNRSAFCSITCRRLSNRKVNKNCVSCGKKITVKGRQTYCTSKCRKGITRRKSRIHMRKNYDKYYERFARRDFERYYPNLIGNEEEFQIYFEKRKNRQRKRKRRVLEIHKRRSKDHA